MCMCYVCAYGSDRISRLKSIDRECYQPIFVRIFSPNQNHAIAIDSNWVRIVSDLWTIYTVQIHYIRKYNEILLDQSYHNHD